MVLLVWDQKKFFFLSFHKPIKQWNGMVMPPLFFMLEDIKTTLIFLAVLGENTLEAACQENSIEKECSGLSCRHSSPMGWLIFPSPLSSNKALSICCGAASCLAQSNADSRPPGGCHSLCCALLFSLPTSNAR